MTSLHISPELDLPVDAATETFGILAKKGAGKSNAAVVMAEEFWDAGVPWVAIDPKGDWWGVRSSSDGKAPGLALPVFGGKHGDVPLEPTAGALVADLVLGQLLTCVLDVSEFSKAETTRFLLAFAQRLYKQADSDPLHLFLEEAHEYLPQMVRGDQAEMVGAWQRIVKMGRTKGLGCTLVSQRSAALNKDVLTQVDTLIVLRTLSPQDRAAVKGWVDVHADAGPMLDSLPTLADGEAWVWSPEFLGRMERIRFRRRRTFDSGATPKVGQARRAPSTLADVDLGAIKDAMADTIERAKADDPKELRRRIKDLERQLAERPTEVETVVETITETVEVPVLDEELVRRLEQTLSEISNCAGGIESTADGITVALQEANRGQLRHDRQDVPRARPAGNGAHPVADRARPRRAEERADPPARRDAGRPPVPRAGPTDTDLTGPQQRVVDAVAWWAEVGYPTPTKIQVGFIAGYRVGKKVGGTYGNVLGELRSAGLIEYPDPGRVELTSTGMDAANPAGIDQTTEGLQAAVMGRLDGPERRVLQAIIAAYPDATSKQDVGEAAGYTVGPKVGGAFGNILGRLRSLGLIDYPSPGMARAEPILFLEPR